MRAAAGSNILTGPLQPDTGARGGICRCSDEIHRIKGSELAILRSYTLTSALRSKVTRAIGQSSRSFFNNSLNRGLPRRLSHFGSVFKSQTSLTWCSR